MVILVSRCSATRSGLNICRSANDFMADHILCGFHGLLCIAHRFAGYVFSAVTNAKADSTAVVAPSAFVLSGCLIFVTRRELESGSFPAIHRNPPIILLNQLSQYVYCQSRAGILPSSPENLYGKTSRAMSA